MSQEIHPVFAVRGTLDSAAIISTIATAGPWPGEDVSFVWTNFDYPLEHYHDHWELYILVQGSLLHTVNGKRYILRSGNACLIRPEDRHSMVYYKCDSITAINFYITTEYMKQLLRSYGKTAQQSIASNEDLSFAVNDAVLTRLISDTQYLQLTNSLSHDEQVDRCRLLILNLLSEFMLAQTQNSRYPAWLSQLLVDLSNSNFSNRSIKTELVTDSSYSYSRLIHLFKSYMGCTINQYINHQRIERAKEFLTQTDTKIIDIASAIGYDNVTHFNRVFKKSTGQTPSEYRSTHRKQL